MQVFKILIFVFAITITLSSCKSEQKTENKPKKKVEQTAKKNNKKAKPANKNAKPANKKANNNNKKANNKNKKPNRNFGSDIYYAQLKKAIGLKDEQINVLRSYDKSFKPRYDEIKKSKSKTKQEDFKNLNRNKQKAIKAYLKEDLFQKKIDFDKKYRLTLKKNKK